ncbi:MAG: hypothetical protein ACYTG5_09710, partial [Planctomycetota bacterium]
FPVLGGELLVFPVLLSRSFTLAGGQGVPGDGSFTLEVPIPLDTNLLGVNLYAQAGIFDPGVTFSISFTNGVASRVF